MPPATDMIFSIIPVHGGFYYFTLCGSQDEAERSLEAWEESRKQEERGSAT